MFRLVSEPAGPGLYCGKDGLTLGCVPLLEQNELGFTPRSPDELDRIFDAAYGVDSGIDAASRMNGLQSVARALNEKRSQPGNNYQPDAETTGYRRCRSGTALGTQQDTKVSLQRRRAARLAWMVDYRRLRQSKCDARTVSAAFSDTRTANSGNLWGAKTER